MLVVVSGGIFILPFFLVSATGGQLADKYEKSMLTQRVKILEIVIMSFAVIGFYPLYSSFNKIINNTIITNGIGMYLLGSCKNNSILHNTINAGTSGIRLLESNKNITEICYDCGFNNISNFNRIFKKYRNRRDRE